MHLNGATLGLAILALPVHVLSELVTITEYPSSCRAIYTSGSSTATVVRSTVTVSPTPFSDAAINSGATFAIEIQPMGQSAKKRQAETGTYLNAGGYTTTDPGEAVQYRINNGMLSATTGGSVTADSNDTSVPFAISTILGSIRTQFFSLNLTMNWNNTAFADGAAEFFMTPALNGSQRVVAYLKGAHVDTWIPVTFALRPAGGLVIESSTSVGSTSVSTLISMGSMTIPSASATPSAGSGTVSQGASTAVSASATPSGSISPSGMCGPGTGFNCWGAPNGNCCSQYGYCGGNTDRAQYCGTGCRSEYGECDSPSAASSSMAVVPTPSSGSLIFSSSVATSSGGSGVSSSAPMSSGASSIVVMSSAGISSSSSIAMSTAVSPTVILSTSNGVTYTSTPSPLSTMSADTLPTISDGATPIGPGGPGSLTPSSSASNTPSFSFIGSSPSSSMWASSASSAVSSISSAASSMQSAMSGISSSAASSASSATSVVQSAASNASSSMSSAASVMSSMMSSATSSASSAMSSSAMSSMAPASSTAATSSAAPTNTGSASCPASDGTIRTDVNAVQYTIGCGSDTTGSGVGNLYSTRSSYEECFAVCDRTTGCQGFTWAGANGAVYGIGAGNCYFKGIAVDGNPIQFSGSGSDASLVAAIKVVQNETPASSSSMMAMSSSMAASSPAASSSVMSSAVPTSSVVSSQPMMSSSSTSSLVAIPDYSSTVSIISAPVASLPAVSSSSEMTSTTSSAASSSSAAMPSSSAASSTTDTPASSSSSYLVLASPTACDFGDPADWSEDDSYCLIALPTPMVVYGNSDTQTYAATNGYISLTQGSQAYEAERLPSVHIPPATILPFWDDLAIFGSQTPMQGIFYQLFDDGVTYEYYLFRSGVADELYHFTVEYKYATPGVFVYQYYNVGNGNNGQFASVGIQGNSGSASGTLVGFQYAYETTGIVPGLIVTCDTTQDICTSNAPGKK